jgi:hypothetical protein
MARVRAVTELRPPPAAPPSPAQVGPQGADGVAAAGTAAYVALLGLLLAVGYALTGGDRLGSGRFVEAVDHDVLRLRVLGRTIYADQTATPFSSDLATSLALVGVSGMALMALWLAVAGRTGPLRLRWFFLLTALATLLLAFDEMLELTEALSYNLPSLYVPDVLVYGIPAFLFALAFWRLVSASRRAVAAFSAWAGLFFVAEFLDRLPDDRFEPVEEKVEIVAVLALGAGVLFVALHFLAPRAAGANRSSAEAEAAALPRDDPVEAH